MNNNSSKSKKFPSNKEIKGNYDLRTIDNTQINQHWFRLLIENSLDIVSIVDRDGKILYQSPSLEPLLGFLPLERIGGNIFDLVINHPDDIKIKREFFEKVLNSKNENIHSGFRLRHKNGSFINFEVSGINYSGHPELDGIILNYRDISLREKTNIELKNIKYALDESAIVAITDSEGIIKYANDKFLKISKYSKEELIGNTHKILNSGYHSKEFIANIWDTIKSGKIWKGEIKNKAKDGQFYWVDTTIVPLMDEENNPKEYIAIRSDITEKKLSEEKNKFLEEATRIISSSLNYHTVLDNIAKLLVPYIADWFTVDLITKDGKLERAITFHKDPKKIKWANELSEKYPIDYTSDTGVLKVIRTGKSDYYPNITEEILAAVAKDKEQLNLLRQIGFKSVMTVPLKVRNQTLGALTLVSTELGINYTERDLFFSEELANRIAISIDNAKLFESVKAAEQKANTLNQELEERVSQRTKQLTLANNELQRSNIELQDFAYVASHDLQEPLRKISSFSKLLESKYKDQLPNQAQNYIDGVLRSSHRMSNLINDLLIYSRVSTEAKPFENINLNEVIDEVSDDMEVRIQESGAKLKVGKLCSIEADQLQIKLLFQNLISNSIKYAKEDTKPQINITCKVKGNNCTVLVKDNGIGFDEIYLDRIFTIFQRLHGRGEYEGTGIGLAISKKIVERHGGTITAKSKIGEGSTFIVTLPLTQ